MSCFNTKLTWTINANSLQMNEITDWCGGTGCPRKSLLRRIWAVIWMDLELHSSVPKEPTVYRIPQERKLKAQSPVQFPGKWAGMPTGGHYICRRQTVKRVYKCYAGLGGRTEGGRGRQRLKCVSQRSPHFILCMGNSWQGQRDTSHVALRNTSQKINFDPGHTGKEPWFLSFCFIF